jgi:DNA primase
LGLHRTFLYGLERCDPSKPLLLTESCWGPLWFRQNGLEAAALMGNSLTEAQEHLLEPYAEIRICLDNDDKGREASLKIAARLKDKHEVHRAFLLG